MIVCFFGIYKPDYPRNDILISGLRENGVEVLECRESATDSWRYWKLAPKLIKMSRTADLIYAAYPSPVPTILAKILTRKPVATDAFFSMFDAVVNDRKEFPIYHPKSIKLLLLDWLAALCSDLLVTDTDEHRKYWGSWLGIRPNKVKVVEIGVNPKRIFPSESAREGVRIVDVTFHGSYIPLQGVDKIVQAFALLKESDTFCFRMVGSGQDFGKARELISKLGIEDVVEVVERVPYDAMNKYLNATKIVLGIFGDSNKARRVIPNKVYEGLGARKAVITMDTQAIREIFDEHDLRPVEGKPQKIAEAVRELLNDESLQRSLADSGFRKTMDRFTPKPLGRLLLDHFAVLLGRR